MTPFHQTLREDRTSRTRHGAPRREDKSIKWTQPPLHSRSSRRATRRAPSCEWTFKSFKILSLKWRSKRRTFRARSVGLSSRIKSCPNRSCSRTRAKARLVLLKASKSRRGNLAKSKSRPPLTSMQTLLPRHRPGPNQSAPGSSNRKDLRLALMALSMCGRTAKKSKRSRSAKAVIKGRKSESERSQKKVKRRDDARTVRKVKRMGNSLHASSKQNALQDLQPRQFSLRKMSPALKSPKCVKLSSASGTISDISRQPWLMPNP